MYFWSMHQQCDDGLDNLREKFESNDGGAPRRRLIGINES